MSVSSAKKMKMKIIWMAHKHGEENMKDLTFISDHSPTFLSSVHPLSSLSTLMDNVWTRENAALIAFAQAQSTFVQCNRPELGPFKECWKNSWADASLF